MQKLLMGVAATAALALFGSTAFADCVDGHGVTAMSKKQESAVVSTYDGPATPPTTDAEKEAAAATVQTCAEGDSACTPASK